MINRFSLRLFWRHISDGSHHDAGLCPGHDRGLRFFETRARAAAGSLRLHQLCQTKIQNLGVAVGRYHDVFRLQIAVNDSSSVRLRQTVGDLREVLQQPLRFGSKSMDVTMERSAIDKLHGNVVNRRRSAFFSDAALCFSDVVDRYDVWMVQRRSGSRLADKSGDPVLIAYELRRQNLEGNRTIQTRVYRLVHLTHSTGAKGCSNPVVLKCRTH